MTKSEQKALMALQPERERRSLEIAERYRPQIERQQAAEDTAAIWGKKQWSTVDKLAPQDLARVAQAVIRDFPDFGALEVTSYFDLLGGKLRPNAEFWMHVAAGHPEYDGHTLERIMPGSPEWDEWIGVEDHSAIAAAAWCEIRRKDRRQPFVEASYVKASDDILYEFSWLELEAKNRKDALAEAPAGFHRINCYDGVWKAQIKARRDDYVALALKKARTTATRRAVRKAFSLAEAKVVALIGKVDQMMTLQRNGRSSGSGDPKYAPSAPVHPNEREERDKTGWPGRRSVAELPEEDEPVVQRPAAEPESRELGGVVVDEAPAAEQDSAEQALPAADEPRDLPTTITEADRRRMFTWLDDRELGERSAHETLKQLIAEVQGIPVAEVSTKQVHYGEYEAVRALVEQIPLRAGA